MIKLLSLFSGIGAFESALKRCGRPYEVVNYCEIDPHASRSYSQIHEVPETKNLRDVCAIDTAKISGVNLITYGFPCQDISVSGKQHGFEHNGERTRSGLFYEALRIIQDLQPEYAIAENVKALVSKKFTAEFKAVLDGLEAAGYNNYWQVLNAKNYGIPQQRERVFIISIRKDCDAGLFSFPAPQELKLRVKDMLEPEVDDKYYLTGEGAQRLIQAYAARINEAITEPVICASRGRNPADLRDRAAGAYTEQHLEPKNDGTSNTITTVQKDNLLLEPKIKIIGSTNGHQSGNVMHHNTDLCPCLTVAGHVEPLKILQIGNLIPDAGRKFTNPQTGRVYDPQGLSPTINTAQGGQREVKIIETTPEAYRIRKLTPRECYRLMGFTDAEFDSIKGVSNTQLYKQAGNSIVVNVLEAIFRQLPI